MNLYEFKQTKAGMTLVEMVISLVILSILMTSTMGMIVSSNNLFISTSKATIDKQVGDSIFELFSGILRYTTHLEISNAENDAMDQHISVGDIVNEGDDELESGWLYYQPKDADEESLLYDSAFYGTGKVKRTIQYSVQKYVGDDGSSDGKHVELTVNVIREDQIVYTQSAIIRCVNLALVTGAQGNAVSQTDDAPAYNQTLSFSVDEQVVSGGSSAWTIEYKVNEYLAKYNEILSNYYNALIGTTENPGPVTTLNKYYEDNYNKVTKRSVTETLVNDCQKAIFGDLKIGSYANNNINSSGEYPTTTGIAPVGTGSTYTGWTNLRALYQKQIYDLLKFSPSTITENDDPYYMIIADKEELYLGFLLTYYDVDNDGKITKDEYPTFDDPETFFANTVLEKYATGDEDVASGDKMVILGVFTDTNNDTFYVDSKDYYASNTTRTLTVSDSGFADHISGTKKVGNAQFAYVYKKHTTHYAYRAVNAIGTTAGIDTTKNYVDDLNFSVTNNGNSTSSNTEDVATVFTNPKSETWTKNNTKYYWPETSTTITKKTTTRTYTKYSLSYSGKLITVGKKTGTTDSTIDYTPDYGTKYYEYSNGMNYESYRNGFMDYSYFYKTSSVWSRNYDALLVKTVGKITTTAPTEKTTTYKDSTYTDDSGFTSWSSSAKTLIDKLGAQNINSGSFGTMVSTDDEMYIGYRTDITSDGKYDKTLDGKYTPTSCTIYNLTATTDITEGWYYLLEGSEGGTQAYHFFYLDSCSVDTGDTDMTYKDSTGATKTYVVNENKVAVQAGGDITLLSSDWDLIYYCYDQAQYELANNIDSAIISDSNHTCTFKTYDLKLHQYTDWVLYSVDWNSWFSKTSSGLINKVISSIVKLFTGDTSITQVSADNAQDVLGVTGQLKVNSTDLDARSYNLAWMVYASNYGTWYYLPQNSSMASTYLSGTGWYSNQDGPQLLDVKGWENSSALNSDIQNRKLSEDGLFGITYIAGVDFSASTDVNWTSLPSTSTKVSTD